MPFSSFGVTALATLPPPLTLILALCAAKCNANSELSCNEAAKEQVTFFARIVGLLIHEERPRKYICIAMRYALVSGKEAEFKPVRHTS